MRKLFVIATLCLAVTATSSGCFGKFALTRKLYEFNEGVSSDKLIRSVVTWGMIIIPVYAVGGTADFFIFNTLEFLTGSNPIASAECETPAQRFAVVEQEEGSILFAHREVTYRLSPTEAGFRVERNGASIGTAVFTPEGGLTLLDASGHALEAWSQAEVAQRVAAVDPSSR